MSSFEERYVLYTWEKAYESGLESPWDEGWDHHRPSPNRLGIWFVRAYDSRFVAAEPDEFNASDIVELLNDERGL